MATSASRRLARSASRSARATIAFELLPRRAAPSVLPHPGASAPEWRDMDCSRDAVGAEADGRGLAAGAGSAAAAGAGRADTAGARRSAAAGAMPGGGGCAAVRLRARARMRSSSPHVAGPTVPSAVRPRARCNRMTAARNGSSKTPLASIPNARCSAATRGPSTPSRSAASALATAGHVSAQVTSATAARPRRRPAIDVSAPQSMTLPVADGHAELHARRSRRGALDAPSQRRRRADTRSFPRCSPCPHGPARRSPLCQSFYQRKVLQGAQLRAASPAPIATGGGRSPATMSA